MFSSKWHKPECEWNCKTKFSRYMVSTHVYVYCICWLCCLRRDYSHFHEPWFPLCADSCLQSLSEREGWTAKDDTFFLRNQEEHIKPKKIITRIEFDSEWYLGHCCVVSECLYVCSCVSECLYVCSCVSVCLYVCSCVSDCVYVCSCVSVCLFDCCFVSMYFTVVMYIALYICAKEWIK